MGSSYRGADVGDEGGVGPGREEVLRFSVEEDARFSKQLPSNFDINTRWQNCVEGSLKLCQGFT